MSRSGAKKNLKVIEGTIEPIARVIERIRPTHNMKDAGGLPPWKKK